MLRITEDQARAALLKLAEFGWILNDSDFDYRTFVKQCLVCHEQLVPEWVYCSRCGTKIPDHYNASTMEEIRTAIEAALVVGDKERLKTPVYTVNAYKRGLTDKHGYTVGVFADDGSAMQAAIEEEDLRGGKYVCEVLQMTIGTVIAGTSRPHDKRFKVVKAMPDIDYAQIWLESAELRKDTDRLRYVMDDCCFDGFVNVQKDLYSYAMEVAEENGRDEPTADDCLDGFRRLIDCSMSGGDVETGEE